MSNYTGMVFGYMTVAEYVGYVNSRPTYVCVDIFGFKHLVASWQFEKHKGFGKRLRGKASKFSLVLRSVYRNILKRCYDSTNSHYKYYGAKGIHVSEEWLGAEGFKNFLVWSAKNGWRRGLYIDRIDNSKIYSPSNCRFVTPEQSIRNRTVTVLTESKVSYLRELYKSNPYKSTNLFCETVAKEIGVSPGTIYSVLKEKTWKEV